MILVNGAAAASIAVTDRGFAYGDGVFRTLRVERGRPRCWSRHYRKLARDCAALGLALAPPELLAGEVAQVAAGADCAVRITVTRGSGERGYAPPRAAQPTRVVMAAALPSYPPEYATAGVRVRVCETRCAAQPRLAGLKHLNRLENVLARAEWDDPAVAEGLMLDAEGNLVGGTMTNVLIAEGAALATPELSRCGVAGVARERVLEAAQAQGVACRVEPIGLERLLAAEEVILVNSLIGAWPVRALGDRGWRPGQWSARVREWLAGDED